MGEACQGATRCGKDSSMVFRKLNCTPEGGHNCKCNKRRQRVIATFRCKNGILGQRGITGKGRSEFYPRSVSVVFLFYSDGRSFLTVRCSMSQLTQGIG